MNMSIRIYHYTMVTPLHIAMRAEHTQAACLLLECGADPNKRDPDGRLPLYGAVGDSNTELVQVLLNCGADPNLEDYNHRSYPLHLSIAGCPFRIVEMLVVSEADVNQINQHGATPLGVAHRFLNTRAIKLLTPLVADAK